VAVARVVVRELWRIAREDAGDERDVESVRDEL
jgi:hypothetical protein